MNQELRQPYEQLVQAYNQLPEAWTQRFERLEGVSEESLVLRHRYVNLNIELSPLPGVPIECVPECSDPEHIKYIPVARFKANLYAPLECITSPEEGIEALRTLQERRTTFGYSLPDFYRNQVTFGHYNGGVEYVVNLPQIRLERPLLFLPEHNLPTLMRTFSFIPYNFNLDVNAPVNDERTEEFRKRVKEYLRGNRLGEDYETRNPTARIMGSGCGWFNFWYEDEETLRATSKDLEAIAQSASVQNSSPYYYKDPFRITSTITPRKP